MEQNSKWPSFAIQGFILATSLYLIEPVGVKNCYVFVSILLVLCLFCLQATSKRFIFLFPVRQPTGTSVTHWDTQILRIGIFLSAFFLYLALCEHFPAIGQLWFRISAVFLLLIVPLLFNFFFNKKIMNSVNSRFQQRNTNVTTERGAFQLSESGIAWFPTGKAYQIDWGSLENLLEDKGKRSGLSDE